MKLSHNRKTMAFFSFCFFCLLILTASQAFGSASAGYSEFYIPGDEELLLDVLSEIGEGGQGSTTHCYITVTAWSDNTTIYYDHWEDAGGYDFDPDDPTTADETIPLAKRGDSWVFESGFIPADPPTLPRGTAEYYDGRDRIYVAGGAATVSRAGWTEDDGTLLAVAWEVYPVRPQLTTYILPFGENLADTGGADLQDFERVFAMIQATSNGTVVTIDFDGDGIPDQLDQNRDGDMTDPEDDITVELDAGEVYLLSNDSSTAISSLDSGTIIKSSSTVQVQYIIGDEGSNFEIRGLSAFPRGLWDDEYYAPVDGANDAEGDVDIYLYNPQDDMLTIEYQTQSGSGLFTINSKTTASFQAKTGTYVPLDSAVYFKGINLVNPNDNEFWGVSTIDTSGGDTDNDGAGRTHDWGYSLVPAFLLENEHFMGWAPGAHPVQIGGGADDSGIFIAPAQDNIRVFIDFDNDGTADQTYDLGRLETQYVYDPNDGDMSGANIYATGPYTLAYGQNPETAPGGTPALDLGYTTIPGNDFIDLVFTVDKSVSPQVVSTTSGSRAQWTLEVNTYDFSVDSIFVTDTLPSGWEYVAGSTVITLPDNTQVTGATANDGNSSGDTTLTWSGSDVFGGFADLAANQKSIITFTAETNQAFTAGEISRNFVEATGTRTVEGVNQTFSTTDFAFVTYGDYAISKTSSGSDPLGPGDQYTYTIEVTNPATATEDLTGISIYDAIPTGVSYVAGTSRVQSPTSTVGDRFNTAAYNNQDGTDDWTGNWVEAFDDGSPTSGDIQISNNELQLSGDGSQLYIYRFFNLSGATSAFWSFNYRTTAGVDAADRISLYINDGGGWSRLYQITGITGESSGTHREDISSYISANTRVAFVILAGTDYSGSNETFAVDNNYILYDDAIDTAAGTPPNFLSAGDGYGLIPGETLTLTFDVVVDDPLPTGLDKIINMVSVTNNEFSVPLTAQVSNLVNNPSSRHR